MSFVSPESLKRGAKKNRNYLVRDKGERFASQTSLVVNEDYLLNKCYFLFIVFQKNAQFGQHKINISRMKAISLGNDKP